MNTKQVSEVFKISSCKTKSFSKTGSTKRTEMLKQNVNNAEPQLCAERVRIETEVYKQTEGEPQIIRKAKVFKKLAEEMSVYINRGELLVGNEASTPRGAPVLLECKANWVERELDTFETRNVDKFITPPQAKKIIRENLPYWKRRTVEDRARSIMPEETRKLMDFEYPVFSPQNMLCNAVGHIIVNYEKVLKIGLRGVRKQIEQKLKELELTNPEDLEKMQFYRAELIVLGGVLNYAKRYAQLARDLAAKEANPQRKKELEKIAEICVWVPANPARNFYEAVQSYLFIHVLAHFETDAQGMSTGRFDYILYPYYKKDKETGILTKEQALELVECYFIKTFEMNHLFDLECATYFSGYSITDNMILGGQDAGGKNTVNELSYICLEAESRMKFTQPAISVQIDKNTPRDFLLKACEVVSMGGGKPSFFNNEILISQLLSESVSLRDARNCAIIGCVEGTSIGNTYSWSNAAMFNLGKCLELALNQGKCRLTGKQLGPITKDPKTFTCFEELMEAFRTQVAYFVKHMVIALNSIDRAHAEVSPLPFLSLVTDDAIGKGRDISRGGARYNFTGPQAVGIADIADSLAAIKKLVFEDREIEISELIEALDYNFKGKEELRNILISRVPKYGNNIDYVDFIAREVGEIYCEEVSKYKNPRGGHYRPGIYPVSANVPLGLRVAALPSGRKAKVALADGISPCHNCDQKGPTAILNSAAKLDHIKATNGTQLNQWLTPTLLKSKKGIQCFTDLIRGYFDQGGFHVQFNVVSKDMLKDAQKHPEEYKTLMVRVAGYSAYFVTIDKCLQDDIINRTEQLKF